MEDMFIKPGNQERGWNDPPQFSYDLQTARGPRKNLLTKRVAPPEACGPGAPPPAPPSSSPLAPPPCGTAPPPQSRAPPPPCMATPPPPLGPVTSLRDPDSSQSESEPDVESVVSALNWALGACRQAVPGQVCDDVAKRIRVLESSWRSGRLSLPVRRRMSTLTQELRSGHWDSADDIHRSLMVDHVTEVSQWMVGIKRLIAETRKLSPELLELVQNPAESEQNPAETDQNTVEPDQNPAEPNHNPVEPKQTSSSQS